jgi:anti-sigma factor RsiW
MNTAHVQELLSAFLEGELDGERAKDVREHLASCPDCAALLEALTLTGDALGAIPEIDPSPALLRKLYAIPDAGKKKFHFVRDVLLRPALQPYFAGATGLLAFISFLAFSPAGHSLRKSFDRQLHAGYNQVERLYAKAGSITDEIGAYKDTLLGSLKDAKILKAAEDKK